MTSGELSIIISPESLFNDTRALLDSYALCIAKGELVYLHTPVFLMPLHGRINALTLAPPKPGNPVDQEAAAIAADWIVNGAPEFEAGYTVSLTRFEPTQDPDDRRAASNIYTRWPFFVAAPLRLMLVWNRTNYLTQWWQFDFHPGQQYTERSNP